MRHPQKPLNPIKKGFFLKQENFVFVFSSNHISKMAASQIIFTVESPLIGGLIFLLKVCFMDPTAP